MTIKNKPDKELLYKLYVVDELSPAEISDIYNCDSSTIRVWIKSYNIHLRTRKESQNTKRILNKKHNNMLGNKNPSKREDIKAKMRKSKYKNDPIKRKEFCNGCAQRVKDHHYKAGSDSAKQQGNKIRGDKNPSKLPGVGAKISETNMGRIGGFLGKTHAHESNIKRSCSLRGIDIEDFDNFISFDPYCEKFNEKKKKEVRDKYNNCDYLTGIHRDICNIVGGKVESLSVHHVDYNKQQGCNEIKWKLIPVSKQHNTMFNKNRSFWEKLILYALEYDKEYYKIEDKNFNILDI